MIIKHAYAYSGIIDVTGTTTQVTMLEFSTNSEYIESIIQFMSVESGGNDLNFYVYLNDIIVGTHPLIVLKEIYHSLLN